MTDDADDSEVYRNEFAMVRVSRVRTPTGVRLSIRDLASDGQILLDPLELEALTRLRHTDFAALVDPSGFVVAPEPDADQV